MKDLASLLACYSFCAAALQAQQAEIVASQLAPG